MKLLTGFILGGVLGQRKPKPVAGCNPADLDNFYKIHERGDPNCKPFKGYVTNLAGVLLEARNNQCKRTCKYDNVVAKQKVKCRCKRNPDKTWDCNYQVKPKGKSWRDWRSTDSDGLTYLPFDTCKPSTWGEWGEWGEYGECSATCGKGVRTRTRACSEEHCEGDATSTIACVDYQSTSCGPRGTWYVGFRWSQQHYEGNYCIFPSYGKGWFDEEMDGTRVRMGVECEGEDQWDLGDHVIAYKGTTCKLVCKADNGEEYRPAAESGSDVFSCSNPIPIDFYKEKECYQNPFTLENDKPQQCVVDWIEQGLALRDATIEAYETVPWYFNRQTWPRSGCWPGCPAEESLSDKASSEKTGRCFKVTQDKCPTPVPVMSEFEKSMGARDDGISWSCTDGDNPRSICTKSCENGHIGRTGNFMWECMCDGDCEWKMHDRNSVYIIYDRPGECFPSCNAYPDALGDSEYVVTCPDFADSSDSISTQAVVYDWNDPAPIQVGNTCDIGCDTWTHEMRGGNFSMSCDPNGPNSNQWSIQAGQRNKCEKICRGPWKAWNEEVEGIWDCDDGQFVGTVCTKTCPEGYKLQNSRKNKLRCKSVSYGSKWQGSVANCVPE